MESIVVVGAAGFIGQEVSRRCRSEGLTTIGVDVRSPGDARAFSAFHVVEQGVPELSSILTETKPDYLLNLAGNADVSRSVREPRYDFSLSVDLFSAILDQVRQLSPGTKVLLASSAAVYGQPGTLPISEALKPKPISPYGYHKWMSELLAQEYHSLYGIGVCAVRIFSAYGPGLQKQILWDLCKKCALDGQVQLSGDGTESRDFVHVSDIAAALLCILRKGPFEGEAINVGSGRETTIGELSKLVIREFGLESSRLVFSGVERAGDPKNWLADVSQLKTFGYSPSIELEEGITGYVNWFRSL